MRVLANVAAGIGALAIQIFACAPEVAAEVPGVVVAVVEPRTAGSGPGELSYSVSLGESKLTTTLTILNGLARPRGERLAILIHQDIPIGTLGTLVSMASKAGYSGDNIVAFIFYAGRTSMLEIPGYRSVTFSTDPEVVSGLLR